MSSSHVSCFLVDMLSVTPPRKVQIFPAGVNNNRKLRRRGSYQRFIVACLVQQVSCVTRRVLAKQLAKKFGMSLKNAYTHTYIELNEILVPSGIIEQDGTLPATRGPKIFQLNGVPYFRLSALGILVACSLDEIDINERIMLFRRYLGDDKSLQKDSRKKELLSHLQAYPEFTLELLKHGVSQYLEGKVEHPLSVFPMRKLRSSRSVAVK